MAFSLRDFRLFSGFPHVLVYIFYLFIKYCTLFYLIISLVRQRKRKGRSRTGLEPRPPKKSNCWSKNVIRHFMYFSRWLVKLIFGGEDGIVSKQGEYTPDDEKDENDIPTLYIRLIPLVYREIIVLFLLIVCFGLLALVTLWDMFWLKLTTVCTEDTDIHCFPIAIDPNSTDGLNITDEMPIVDCSIWQGGDVSALVRFNCYQFVYDFEGSFGAVGGLLAIFVIAMRIAASITYSITRCLLIFCCSRNKFTFWVFRILLSLMFIFFDLYATALLVLVAVDTIGGDNATLLTLSSLVGGTFATFIVNHGNQVLLIIGIIGSSLLLPFEEFVEVEELKKKDTNIEANEKGTKKGEDNVDQQASSL